MTIWAASLSSHSFPSTHKAHISIEKKMKMKRISFFFHFVAWKNVQKFNGNDLVHLKRKIYIFNRERSFSFFLCMFLNIFILLLKHKSQKKYMWKNKNGMEEEWKGRKERYCLPSAFLLYNLNVVYWININNVLNAFLIHKKKNNTTQKE